MPDPSQVSVVIPTTGRPELLRAVQSALGQTRPPLGVLVGDDGKDELPQLPQASNLRVLRTGGKGPNAARAMGIQAAGGALIALLDDDDWWFPQKLERQLATIPERDTTNWFSVCRTLIHGRGRPRISPAVGPESQSVSSYLLRRRQVRSGRQTMPTPTIVAPRDLFLRIPLDESLWIHEDLDWLIRASKEAVVYFCDEVLVVITRLQQARLTTTTSWQTSLAWADSRKNILDPREYADFCLTMPWSLATRARDSAAYPVLLRRAWKAGRPSLPAIIYAAAQVGRNIILARRGGQR